jgi:hypothetical protein
MLSEKAENPKKSRYLNVKSMRVVKFLTSPTFFYNHHTSSEGVLKALFILLLCLLMYSGAMGSNIFTATKDCSLSPCTFTGNGVTFAIGSTQIVRWEANLTGSATGGNDFYLTTDPSNLIQVPISTNLSPGFNTGTLTLPPGNYFISIQFFGMGSGTYTIEYDLTANCTVTPTSYNYGNLNAGSSGINRTFSLVLAGDMLDVEIGAISGTDNTHFVVSGGTGTILRSSGPTTVNFIVRFEPGTVAGVFSSTITIVTSNPDGVNVPDKTITVTGTTVALVPNIDCVVSTPFELDYLAAPSGTFNVSFRNGGNAPLVISSITIGANPDGVFTINGAPITADLPPANPRPVSIRFTPPAMEQTYTGSIIIASNSPGETIKECLFTARAHHPEPIMVVSAVPNGGTTVNYQDVEIGFTYTRAIKVGNIGDAPLNLTLDLVNAANPDLAQWSEINEPNGVIIAPGDEQIFLQRFKPMAVGSYTFELTAQGTGGGGTYNSSSIVTLTGNGINPVPMDNVLVLDRSGSMADAAGSRTKIDALQKAARLYYDLLRTDPGDGSGDQIGMVKYNSSSQNYLTPLQLKSPMIDPTVLDLLSEVAINDAAKLQPNGGTCISCGMTDGAKLLLTSPDTRKQIMVVMTDGMQTAGPNVTEAFLNNLETANPDMMIYSLGLGNSIDAPLLGRITNAGTGGYHQVSEDLLGTNHFALEEFYFKIYANASGADLVVDPTFAVNLANGNAVEVDRAHIVSSDRSAMFMVLDDPALTSYYKLEFVDPHGTILDPTSSVGGIPIQILKRAGHTIYKIIFPDISQANSYTGDWVLRLNPTGKWKPGGNLQTHNNKMHENYQVPGEWIHPHQGVVPIGFGAAVKSDYNMQVSVTANNYQPGAEVLLSVTLYDRGWPSVGGNIEIVATRPNNSDSNFLLYDDGTHGDTNANDGTYSNLYNNTTLEGNYRFFFDGIGINERGEMVPRQATRYVSLFAPGTDGDNNPGDCKNCFPCWLYYLILLLSLITLLLIIRCCRKMKTQSVG